jgi:4-aminobutyrate aminotransferase-like enzyme
MLGLREMFSVESRVESCGPNLAIEIDPRGERSNPEAGLAFEFGQKLAGRWTAAARDLGLLVHHSGRHGNRVVVIPPLTISDLEIEDAMVRLSGALTSCYRSSR